jgi:hypothetical protein
MNEFKKIGESKKNVVMIIANGDISFNDHILKFCPNNVKHIFSTNTTCDNDFVTPIPIGVEMDVSAKRPGHGEINKEIFEKLPFLTGEKKVLESEFKKEIYSNFRIETNLGFRNLIKDFSIKCPHINFEYGIDYEKFVSQVQSHLGTLSPRGNGIECIRTYEVLYLNSIPIVIGDQKEYKPINEKIYKKLPIIFIDDVNKLNNLNLIEKEINNFKNFNREVLDYHYWLELIKNKIKKIL